MMTRTETKLAYHISRKSMLINVLLCVVKGAAGFFIHSVSLLSDAVHSLTDIFSTLVVMIGLRLSNKPADDGHPYGHEKIECVIAFLLGLMLFVIGGVIGWEGIVKINAPAHAKESTALLNIFALAAAALSIAAKEWMYRFTIKCAKELHSPSMTADAWHHRSDALSSVGSLAGVIGICLDMPVIDVLACFVISVFIFKAAYDICANACKGMIDAAADEETVSVIRKTILSNPDVLSLDMIKTRRAASKLYVDIEVTADRHMSFQQAHSVAHTLHESILADAGEVKYCMIHINPSQ